MSTPGLKTITDLDAIHLDRFASDAERYAAKEAARRLLSRLETPFERGWTLTFETPVLIAALQVCLNLGIWAKWYEAAQNDGVSSHTLDQIASMSKEEVEPNLLRRSAFIHVHILTER